VQQADARRYPEVEILMRDAVRFHLEYMREQAIALPLPSSYPGFVTA